jgi:hypothetical protein
MRAGVTSPSENDERDWCERAIGRWTTGSARDLDMFAKRKEQTANAWAARKAKAAEKRAQMDASRKPDGKAAE